MAVLNRLFSANPLSLDWGLLLLRVIPGLLMAFGHGYGKVGKFLSGEQIKFYNFGGVGPQASLGLAAFAEFVCALLVVLGLFHRAALLPLIVTMLVAVFGAHGDDPFGKGENALVYLAVFAALFLTGPGRFSVDHYLFRRNAIDLRS
ncbi:MAG TPA: DoxX family protein [Chitinophagales bacterium]|nr:DoxX family protein [Chitinophagales bacterium]